MEHVTSICKNIKKVVRDELTKLSKKDNQSKHRSLRRNQRRHSSETHVRDVDSYVDPMDDDEQQEAEEEENESNDQMQHRSHRSPRRLSQEDIMMRDLVDAHDED